ncbi:MAG TPA: BON domain-containing protein, partial [Chloroflexota bacterium]|nr:BON domain-containing protein [Chloroflexota bacterium]
RGRRRRARVRDRFTRTFNVSEDLLGKAGRDARHRARGLLAELGAEARYRLLREPPASDAVLAERVRARIGRVATHPSAIEVTAQGSHVTLSGPVLAHELDRLLSAVRGVRGVQEVENRLEAHERPDGVSGLQGAGRARTQLPDPLQRTWSPTTRTVAVASGGALTIYGLERGGGAGLVCGVAGATLLARGRDQYGIGTVTRLSGTARSGCASNDHHQRPRR